MAHPQADLPVIDHVDDFLDWVHGQEERFEFVDGRLLAMGGGSRAHNDIQVNLIGELRSRLPGGPCRVNGPDLLVRTAERRGRFPDASVTCEEEPERWILRPLILFEILSPDTEARDRGQKWLEYQALPSLRHYVLIAQDRSRVEHFRRMEAGGWHYLELEGAATQLRLDPPGLELRLADLYEGARLGAPDER
ncbi:Uma2 family endonuclease [Geminicoccaceae bacterium 1502E]|nr:Uma2 family endonuclease [Geminicoccaceae bacterium 1502E]